MLDHNAIRAWIQRAEGLARARLNRHEGSGPAQEILQTLGCAATALDEGCEEQAYTLLCFASGLLVGLGIHRHQMPWIEACFKSPACPTATPEPNMFSILT